LFAREQSAPRRRALAWRARQGRGQAPDSTGPATEPPRLALPPFHLSARTTAAKARRPRAPHASAATSRCRPRVPGPDAKDHQPFNPAPNPRAPPLKARASTLSPQSSRRRGLPLFPHTEHVFVELREEKKGERKGEEATEEKRDTCRRRRPRRGARRRRTDDVVLCFIVVKPSSPGSAPPPPPPTSRTANPSRPSLLQAVSAPTSSRPRCESPTSPCL
ncbi:unnamed protein product, partial [Urochloa humidicola]